MNLLVTGAWSGAKDHIQRLLSLGHNTVFLQNENDELPCEYSWVEGVICNSLFLSHNIELFSNLRYIQLTSAGYDRIPVDYIKAKGLRIHNARGVYDIPIAEMALTGVLCLYKRVEAFFENKSKHLWEKYRYLPEIYGKNVVVIGCGSIGTECAKRFKSLSSYVIGVDIIKIENSVYDAVYTLENIEQALGSADVIIVTLPLTEQTKWFFDSRRFNCMKPGAVFVNVSRGSVVKTDDLMCALKSRLGGAVLDVFETEPLPEDSPLWNMDNVFITPHNSFSGEGNEKRLSDLIFSNLGKEIS